jgi:hypothetical protein
MELSAELHVPVALPQGHKAPGTHWVGDWVGTRAGLDVAEKIKILHCRESNPGFLVHRPTLCLLSYPDSRIFIY